MLDLASLAPMIEETITALRGQPRNGLMCWAIEPRGVEQSLAVVRDVRMGSGTSLAVRRGSAVSATSFARRIGNVGIVPVYGPLMARRSRAYFSYDELADDLAMFGEMGDIDAVVLDINSPGGLASGIEVAEDAIRSVQQSKPVVSFIDGMGASAAYWIASTPGEVTATVSSLVGSIGAVVSFLELDGILTNLGARKIEVLAEVSPNKRLDPESEEGRAELKAITDDAGERFLDALAANRQLDRTQLLENYGQGLVFPAREAGRRGMVDRITTLEELVAQLADQSPSDETAVSAAASTMEHDTMSDPKQTVAGAPAADPNKKPAAAAPGISQAELDSAVNAAKAEGHEEGAKAATERLTSILGAENIKGSAARMTAAIDLAAKAPGMSADEVTAFVTANVAVGTESSSGIDKVLSKMDAAANGVESSISGAGGAGGTKPAASTPEGWKAEWEASDKLQAEYPTADAYVATKKREARTAA